MKSSSDSASGTESPLIGRITAALKRNQGVLGLVILILLSSLPIGFYVHGVRVSLYSQYFWSWSNFANVFRQTSIVGVMAVGMTFVILTGGIELSVGSALAFLSVAAALMCKGQGSAFVPIIIAVIALGTIIGGISGTVVTRGKFQPFIATLAAMVTLRGLTFRLSGGNIVNDPRLADTFAPFSHSILVPIPSFLQRLLGTSEFWNPIPVFAVIFIAMVVLGQILLTKTVFGRNIVSLGGNEEAARLSGIPVDRTKIAVYALNGALVALAALMFTARTSTGDPGSGIGYELDAIAAAVVGGTALSGGRGTIVGTLIGALFIGVLNNSLQLNSIDRYTALAMEGPIILLAVGMQRRKS
jgi:ribose transport system permease protein